MSIKDKGGLYPNWIPIALLIGVIIYTLLCLFIFFPLIDSMVKP